LPLGTVRARIADGHAVEEVKHGRNLTLLLAVDKSTASDAVIAQAVGLAMSLEASVHVLHVWSAAAGSQAEADAKRLLQDVARACRRRGITVVECLQRASGRGVGHDVAVCAREAGVDLVVMGSEDVGDVQAILLGSVIHEVLREVDQPIVVLRGKARTFALKHILVAAAGGDEVRLAAVVALVAPPETEVIALHVPEMATRMNTPWAEAADHALATAEAAAAEIRLGGQLATAQVRWGPVAYTIIEAARAAACDLIVLGSRPPSDLAAALIGSVSHQVIQKSDRPVLVTRKARNHEGDSSRRAVDDHLVGRRIESPSESSAGHLGSK
jgi:nucleotide-binding universal stress UspA family protein